MLDDVVLGYAVGEVEALADGRCLGRVHEVFVDEGARGIGLGAAILDDLVGWFGERGCVGVDAPALPGHRQAKNFFEGHGFVARLLVMHHPIGATGVGAAGLSDAAGEG
jgi:GNAT superfamily N-acetyltransferase